MLIAFATLAGVLITLFGIYIGQRVGLMQISIAHKEHDLNLLKSAPVIDTAVRIIERQINPAPAFAPFYYIVTTINNYGELAAQQLNGHWRLYSPDHSIQQHDIPIVRNALGSSRPRGDAPMPALFPYKALSAWQLCPLSGPGPIYIKICGNTSH